MAISCSFIKVIGGSFLRAIGGYSITDYWWLFS